MLSNGLSCSFAPGLFVILSGLGLLMGNAFCVAGEANNDLMLRGVVSLNFTVLVGVLGVDLDPCLTFSSLVEEGDDRFCGMIGRA